jgi:hypothetical protein
MTAPVPETADTTNDNTGTDDDDAADGALGAGGICALRAERRAHAEARRALTDAQAELERLRGENGTLSTEATRTRVALTAGLPGDLLPFLKGDTEDEVTQAAAAIMAHVGNQRQPAPRPDPTQGGYGHPSDGPTGFADAIGRARNGE